MRDTSGRRRLESAFAIALLCASVAVGAGCGDSGDDSGDGGATAQTSSTASEQQVGALMSQLRERYNAANGAGFCAGLTAKGRREVEAFAQNVPKFRGRDCGAFMAAYIPSLLEQGGKQTPPKVRSVKVSGDTATVTLTGGLAGTGLLADYKVAKQSGEWKLADPISGAKTKRRLQGQP